MLDWTRFGRAGLVLGALAAGAGGAWGDVTPEEVWQNWQDLRTAMGQTLTAEAVERQGDALIVSGIRLEVPGDNGTTSALLSEIRFRDLGDGSVAVVLPDSFPVVLSIAPDPDLGAPTRQEVTLDVTMPGARTTASGTKDAINYAIDAPALAVKAQADEGAERMNLALEMAGVTGTSQVAGTAEKRDASSDLAAQSLNVTLDVTGRPDSEGRFHFSVVDLGLKAEMTGLSQGDGGEALRDGATVDALARYGVGSFDLEGKDAGEAFKATGALGGGSVVVSAGADHFAYDATGKSMSLNGQGGDMRFSATLAESSAKLRIEGTDWMAPIGFEAALARGLKLSGSLGLGPTAFDFQGPGAVKLALGGLETHFALDNRGVDHGTHARAVDLAVRGPDLPLPEVAVTLGDVAVDFAMPLAKTETPAPFKLLVKVVDLGLGEALWAVLDGAGLLPHDPATLILDSRGTMTLLEDMSKAGETLEGAPPPVLLDSLELAQLLVRALGAEVAGQGAVTVDNGTTGAVPGMPLVTGKMGFAGKGVLALMDKLVTMGVLTGEDVTMARLMAGAFARIDPVKDEITSELEFKDGQLFANGAKIE